MRARAAAALALWATATAAGAQQPTELITDRPDFTESPVVVPLHSVQVETGVTWERDRGASAFTGPEALVRWSPLPRVELRVALPDYNDAGPVAGFGDAGIGAKVEFAPLAGWRIAALAGVSLPTGAVGLTSDRVNPEILFTAGRDLTAAWSLGTQVALEWLASQLVLGATLVVGAGVFERLGAFLELAASGPTDGPAALVLHHGYTFATSPATQIDLHVGVGVSDAAPGFLLGAGLSARF